MYAIRSYYADRPTDPDRVKVVDFGLAKVAADDSEEEITEAGLCMGSPSYMAPEQIEGGAVGPETDIYALGAILYRMLSGQAPYPGSRPYEILMAKQRKVRVIKATAKFEGEHRLRNNFV